MPLFFLSAVLTHKPFASPTKTTGSAEGGLSAFFTIGLLMELQVENSTYIHCITQEKLLKQLELRG